MNHYILQIFTCYQILEFFSHKAKTEDALNVENLKDKIAWAK